MGRYMLNYFWEVGAAEIMLVVVAAPVGVMLGAFLAPAVFERWSKRAGLIFGTLGWAFWQTLPVVLRLLGGTGQARPLHNAVPGVGG